MSDLHMGAQSPEKERSKRNRFQELVATLGAEDRLFLLGDIFDVWVGRRDAISPGHQEVLAVIEGAASRGVAVLFIAGNHDFCPGSVLSDGGGVAVEMEGLSVPVPNFEALYLTHGDEPAGANRMYGLLRFVLRSRFVEFLMRALPAKVILSISHWASRTSREHSESSNGARWLDRYQERVAKPLWSRGHRIVICGHHHVGAVQGAAEGMLVNLGHWFDEPTYAIREGPTIRLLRDCKTGPEELGRVELRPSETR